MFYCNKPFSASTECNNVRFLLLAQDVFSPTLKKHPKDSDLFFLKVVLMNNGGFFFRITFRVFATNFISLKSTR